MSTTGADALGQVGSACCVRSEDDRGSLTGFSSLSRLAGSRLTMWRKTIPNTAESGALRDRQRQVKAQPRTPAGLRGLS